MLANNIEKYIEEGIWLPKKIIIDLNYLRSEGSIALTLKRNCAKWHKNCTLKIEVTSSRLKRALSNVSKKKKGKRTSNKNDDGGGGGERGSFPLPNLNRFILPKAENVSFWMLCFKLQAWRVLRFIIFR